jgi:mannose-6-phosphate isomerase-like protein (cupin superfamily)
MQEQNAKHLFDQRPWGSWEILTQFPVTGEGLKDTCVKTLVIKPGSRPSYQSHKERSEHWFVVQGEGVAVLEGKEIPLKAGQSVDIPVFSKHRILNTSKDVDLIFIEIHTGHYDENDIERFEDDYGRVKNTTI